MHEIIAAAKAENRNLLEPEAIKLFQEYGLPVPGFKVAKTKEEAVAAARLLGYPVVLKIISRDILHKSDVGGVKVNIQSDDAMAAAYDAMMEDVRRRTAAEIEGVMVVEQADKGVECIVGMVQDQQFGPAIMFGLGGIFVEVLKDVSFRLLPLSREEAETMIKETKGYQLLKGIRGEKAKDIIGLTECIVNAARLVGDNPEIRELDINPLFVYEQGLKVVDGRVLL